MRTLHRPRKGALIRFRLFRFFDQPRGLQPQKAPFLRREGACLFRVGSGAPGFLSVQAASSREPERLQKIHDVKEPARAERDDPRPAAKTKQGGRV